MKREKKIKREKRKPREKDQIPPIRRRGDFWLFIAVFFLLIFGIAMVFSASYYDTIVSDNNPYIYLFRQAAFVISGLGFLLFFTLFDYNKLRKFALPAILVSYVLLIAVLIPGIGANINNATRWIPVGPFTIMPGEIAKFGVILFLAWFYANIGDSVRSFRRGVALILVGLAIMVVLIMKQPNLSTLIIIVGITFLMMFFAGVKTSQIVGLGLIGAGALGAYLLINPESEHMKRLTTFMYPFEYARGEAYQLVQSLLALGSGGVIGLGPGKSIQKALYLPEAHNDFIFAIVGEEWGFIGCIIILLIYLFIIYRCVLISINAPDRFAMLFASGITALISLQVILNIAVVTGVAPTTGVTLPFISYGGNATWLLCASMGVMLSISRRSQPPVKLKKKTDNEQEQGGEI
jgi:cell division protein FtsW